MKCLVPVKRVIDPNVKINIKADGSAVETENVKMSMNPFDEIALEEAVRLKEKGIVTEVVAVSVGMQSVSETLRLALARGADRAILVECQKELEPFNIALILKSIAQKERPLLIIMGKQAIDDDCNQTGQMLSGLLGWAQGTYVSKVTMHIAENLLEVEREVDHGLEVLMLNLPAVITTDLRLNQPRYVSLPNIVRAKSKPMDWITIEQLGLSLKEHVRILKLGSPKIHRNGIKVKNAKELVDRLKDDKII